MSCMAVPENRPCVANTHTFLKMEQLWIQDAWKFVTSISNWEPSKYLFSQQIRLADDLCVRDEINQGENSTGKRGREDITLQPELGISSYLEDVF